MRVKYFTILLVFIMVLFISSCADKSERVWNDTIDDAIQQGLLKVSASEIQRILIDNETIILYKLNGVDAVGVGSVTESDEGYSWYHGMEPFSAPFVQLDYQTESKQVIPLTIGKISDETIKEVTLEGKSKKYHLEVVNGYYFGANIEMFY